MFRRETPHHHHHHQAVSPPRRLGRLPACEPPPHAEIQLLPRVEIQVLPEGARNLGRLPARAAAAPICGGDLRLRLQFAAAVAAFLARATPAGLEHWDGGSSNDGAAAAAEAEAEAEEEEESVVVVAAAVVAAATAAAATSTPRTVFVIGMAAT